MQQEDAALGAVALGGRFERVGQLHERAVEPHAQYRVTVNDFLLNGGDRFTALRRGRDPRAGPVDVEALEAYFHAQSPVQPPSSGRIRRLP